MACFPINGRNQTAIYLSWPSTAASWRLIHAGHGNSRKELIEEPRQAMAPAPLQSGVPAIRQPGLCLQADVPCAACLPLCHVHVQYVGNSFRSLTHSWFCNLTHRFHSTRAKVCTCSSTQIDKHCMMMDRTFFPPLLLLFSVSVLIEPCEQCLENSSGNTWKTSADSQIHFLWFKVCVHFVHLFPRHCCRKESTLDFCFFSRYFGVTLELHAEMCMWKNLYLPACDASQLLFLCIFSQCAHRPCTMCSKAFLPVVCENTAAMISEKSSFHFWFDRPQNHFLLCLALSLTTSHILCNLMFKKNNTSQTAVVVVLTGLSWF